MLNQSEIRRLAHSSVQYEMNGGVMMIQGYYEPDLEIKIDLSKLTPEMLEELAPDEDEWDEDEW